MHSKKGMGIEQVFIFIIAAITFALVMIFGYRAINSFLQSGEGVEFVQFKNDLENSVKRIYTEYGARRVEQFRTPEKYKRICFVDLDAPYFEGKCERNQLSQSACLAWEKAQQGYTVSLGNDNDGNPVTQEIKGYEASDENIFLEPLLPGTPKIKVHRIKIKDGEESLCVNIVNGVFSIKMEGLGDGTELAAVS